MPENPEEITEDIINASEQGAAVAHIHARDEKGNATFDPEYYRRIIEGVRKHCDVIIQISTGGPPAAVEDKLAPIRELRPHMASLNIKGSAEEIEYTANTMIKQPAHFELVFDLVSDSDKSVLEDYDEMVQRTKAMFPGSMWSRNRGAYNQFALDVITIMLGGHIRVGLEDNLFLTRGQFAQSSAEFVKRVVHLSAELNRKVASVEEAKQLFKIIH
jgi:3-keto-5-aminohexanoate cleavage enzyme